MSRNLPNLYALFLGRSKRTTSGPLSTSTSLCDLTGNSSESQRVPSTQPHPIATVIPEDTELNSSGSHGAGHSSRGRRRSRGTSENEQESRRSRSWSVVGRNTALATVGAIVTSSLVNLVVEEDQNLLNEQSRLWKSASDGRVCILTFLPAAYCILYYLPTCFFFFFTILSSLSRYFHAHCFQTTSGVLSELEHSIYIFISILL